MVQKADVYSSGEACFGFVSSTGSNLMQAPTGTTHVDELIKDLINLINLIYLIIKNLIKDKVAYCILDRF